MAAKLSKRLQTVLRVAELKQKRAAEVFSDSSQQAQAQLQQGQQLESYQQEYCEQFRSGESMTMRPDQLQNFQRFYNNLDSALETQQQRIELSASQLEQARKQWQQQYARQKNMESLIQRVELEEERDDEIKLQRELDDRFATKKDGHHS